jgi:hypothetical protein
MASGADLTAYDPVLKEHYTMERVRDMTYRSNPFLGLVPKYENFGGKVLPVPIMYGNPQGRSKTFSNAQARAQATSSLFKEFSLTRAKDYSLATIDNETLEATKGDPNAFMDAATTEIDGAINSLKRSLGSNVFRDTSAAIGQVNAEPSENASTFDIVIKSAGDISNFEVGQMIVIYSAKSGGTLRTSDGSDDEWEIAGVNRASSSPTITLTGTYDASGTIAADDYLFVEGDRGLGVAGLEDWIPASAPSATAFFGVDRTVDVTRLAGHRLDGSSAPLEEVLAEADAIVAGNGGFAIDHFFLSHTAYKNLKNSLGSKVQYVDLEATPRVSFRGVMVDGVNGPIKCVPDINCPDNRIFGVQLDTWKFYSLGPMVRLISPDGLQMLRQASDDGAEVRYGFYGNLGCRGPGASINIQI